MVESNISCHYEADQRGQQHMCVTTSQQLQIKMYGVESLRPPFLSTILIFHQYQTLSPLSASTSSSSDMRGSHLCTDTDSRLEKDTGYTKSTPCITPLSARTQILPVELFCNQLIEPRFQQRRALLLVNTKHSTSARLFDWLTHIIRMPFLDSNWSLVYSMCHCSLLSCKAKQSKLTMKLTYAHRTYGITALK